MRVTSSKTQLGTSWHTVALVTLSENYPGDWAWIPHKWHYTPLGLGKLLIWTQKAKHLEILCYTADGSWVKGKVLHYIRTDKFRIPSNHSCSRTAIKRNLKAEVKQHFVFNPDDHQTDTFGTMKDDTGFLEAEQVTSVLVEVQQNNNPPGKQNLYTQSHIPKCYIQQRSRVKTYHPPPHTIR